MMSAQLTLCIARSVFVIQLHYIVYCINCILYPIPYRFRCFGVVLNPETNTGKRQGLNPNIEVERERSY